MNKFDYKNYTMVIKKYQHFVDVNVSNNGDRFNPDIYVRNNDDAVNLKEIDFVIQTTSYGALEEKSVLDAIEGLNEAIDARKHFLKILSEISVDELEMIND